MTLPPPTSFAEGQRAAYGWLIAAAGVFCGLMFAALLLVLWLGGWTLTSEGQRIGAIAILGAGFPLGMLSVIIALAVGGPVGRIKIAANRDGVAVEASLTDTPAVTTTTTTATTNSLGTSDLRLS